MMNWRSKDKLLSDVRNYKQDGASHVRVLVYGPVGSGKSSFINSVGSVIVGRSVNVAAVNASNNSTKSFTVEYKTYKFRQKAPEKQILPIVFNDTMGLEDGADVGVRPEDIKLAMMGHMNEEYNFNPSRALLPKDKQYYNPNPSINDRVHVLVCVLSANSQNIQPSVIQKMKEIREAARDLGIPHLAVVTHIDHISNGSDRYLQKMNQFSSSFGIPVDSFFPVRNNYEGENKDEVDTLLLTALKHMLDTQWPEKALSRRLRNVFLDYQLGSVTFMHGLEQHWRVIDWGSKDKLLSDVRNYKPERASHLRILVYGPVGAGKSSFINTVGSVILGRSVNVAEANTSNDTTSFTVQYKTHKFMLKGYEKRTIPIVFNDIMGLEAGDRVGVRPEDIKLAMRGHVKDGYIFNSACALSSRNKQYYNQCPTINDKVHVLVCMLNANSPNINPSVTEKMKEIREAARDLGIPQVAVVTHIDELCGELEKDVRNVFRSRSLKKKVEQFSSVVGIPVNYIFPVRNNYQGVNKDAVDTLMLSTIKNLLDYGEDFLDD